MQIRKLYCKFGEILLTILCLYLCNPFYFKSIESEMKTALLLFSLFPVFKIIFCPKIHLENKSLLLISIIYIYFLLFEVFLTNDISYIIYFIRLVQRILSIISLSYFWKYLYQKKLCNLNIGIIYINSIILYLLTTIYFVLFPSMKLFWTNIIINHQELYIIELPQFITRFSISGWASFGESIWVGTGFIYVVFFYFNKYISKKRTIIYAIIFFLGSAFYGRFGMVVMFVQILIFSLLLIKKKDFRIPFVFIIFLVFIVCFSILLYQKNTYFKTYADWALEVVISYFRENKFRSGSTDELIQMYTDFSPNIKTLVIGDGKWNVGNVYYGSVDMGVLRNLLFGGILYDILIYSFIPVSLKRIYRFGHKFNVKGINESIILMAFLCVACEFKGTMLFSNLKCFIPLYFLIKYYTNREQNQK